MARREAVLPASADFLRSLPRRTPAPFSPPPNVALLRFALPRTTEAIVGVYDTAGTCVRILLNGTLTSGEHACGWDGRNDLDQPMPAGEYVLRLQASGHVLIARRITLH